MSVRLLPLGIERQGLPTSTTVTAASAAGDRPAVSWTQVADADAERGWDSAFASYQSQLNQQVTGAQRALAYLEQLRLRLRELARRLRIDTSVGEQASALVSESLALVRGQWEQREVASGGTLDADLVYCPAGDARQRFRIHGLDSAALRLPDAERLVFYPRGLGRASRTLSLVAGEAVERRWQRLQDALAPAGIRVQLDAGEPILSIAERAWPALRDSLLIHGEGWRFPGGWPVQARVQALPGAIVPHAWQVDTRPDRQQAFRQAGAALILLEQTRLQVSSLLADSARTLHADAGFPAVEAMHRLLGGFVTVLERNSGFLRLATAGACMRGMNRRKVGQVLGE
ncbi:hypothetical protein NRY95_07830 [Xanthomonas campestris pv. phormiicola]|nr:hypothetical protein [Xanthomonas campestris pv. phormiicola]UYC17851.1 hypothetical protein NRY95_07830 [Xanthomonas campestris pv. phormiicola]